MSSVETKQDLHDGDNIEPDLEHEMMCAMEQTRLMLELKEEWEKALAALQICELEPVTE